MSDNATLVERLRAHARLSHSYSSGTDTLEEHLDWEAAARIAELEAGALAERETERTAAVERVKAALVGNPHWDAARHRAIDAIRARPAP